MWSNGSRQWSTCSNGTKPNWMRGKSSLHCTDFFSLSCQKKNSIQNLQDFFSSFLYKWTDHEPGYWLLVPEKLWFLQLFNICNILETRWNQVKPGETRSTSVGKPRWIRGFTSSGFKSFTRCLAFSETTWGPGWPGRDNFFLWLCYQPYLESAYFADAHVLF